MSLVDIFRQRHPQNLKAYRYFHGYALQLMPSSVFYLDLEFVSEGVCLEVRAISLYYTSFHFTSFHWAQYFFQLSGSCVLYILKTLYKHFVLDILPPSVLEALKIAFIKYVYRKSSI